jgi:hypothetical protein
MNNIERLRRAKDEKELFSQAQKATLAQGFGTEFWKLLKDRLDDTFQSLHKELESVTEIHRLHQIQGEIAALKILLDWPAVLNVKEQK